MSYDIYIGEAVVEWPDDADDDGDACEPRIEVKGVGRELPDAPSFRGDCMTGKGNSRHPSYSGWDRFAKVAGLHDFFFDRDRGVMSRHPGCFVLRPRHLHEVEAALMRYRADHPDARPGWCTCDKCNEWPGRKPSTDPHEDLDGDLARLIWLDFWIRWALANCKHPAIYNH